jgi:methionine--tRNA ligase beta chain
MACFLAPYMPRAASAIFWKLNTPPVFITELKPSFDNLKPKTRVQVGQILFVKLETADEKAAMLAKAAAVKATKAAAAAKKDAKGGAKKGKGAGGVKKDKPAAVDPNQPEITKLQFLVGEIKKVWEHPSAEKLWCEEIDVGEEAPRQIASGLRDHYTQEQMSGRKVIVVANLKARKLQGFASAGMVLCAKEGDAVEFVDPPAGAKVGEQITFEGLDGSPVTPAQVDKKKVFQKAQPDMKSDANKVASWKGVKFMTSAGPCTLPNLANAPLS